LARLPVNYGIDASGGNLAVFWVDVDANGPPPCPPTRFQSRSGSHERINDQFAGLTAVSDKLLHE
jgi:hypothetical protein